MIYFSILFTSCSDFLCFLLCFFSPSSGFSSSFGLSLYILFIFSYYPCIITVSLFLCYCSQPVSRERFLCVFCIKIRDIQAKMPSRKRFFMHFCPLLVTEWTVTQRTGCRTTKSRRKSSIYWCRTCSWSRICKKIRS